MPTYRPIYRATLFAPRSEDAAEATVLTPRAGSVHGDAFKVITKSGYYATPFANASAGATWTASGVTLATTVARLADSDTAANAWNTDTAGVGAYVQADFAAAVNRDRCRIFAAAAGLKASYKIRGSADGLAWTDVQSGFVPAKAGWNEFVFTRASYRFWRAELTNAPGAGAWANEIEFADGGSNWQPYLSGGPRGRSSEIDPLEKHSDTGERTWRIMDKRTGAGNLQRWWTAFIGDAKGGNALLGCLWIVDQSLDNGATWTRFSTDRVAAVRLSRGSKVWVDITVADRTDDLDAEVFVGPPHADVASYAHQAQITPLGLMKQYADVHPVELVQPIRAKVVYEESAELFQMQVDFSQPNGKRTLYTKLLHSLSIRGVASAKPARLWVRPIGGAYTRYELAWADPRDRGGHNTTSIGRVYGRRRAGGAAPPALNTAVEFYIDSDELPVSAALPLLINDVHPVTLLRHLCEGKFGKLKGGAVTWSVPTDAGRPGSTFDALEADATIPTVRFIITEREELRDFAERELLRHNHIALKLDEFGRVALVDMRRRSVASPVATLTNADLVSGPDSVEWETSKEDAVRTATEAYYRGGAK